MSNTHENTRRISNRRAEFHFDILERLEAGIALTGSEVKSLRAGQASLEESYAYIENGRVALVDCNISPYPMAGYAQHHPTRPRPLLLHKREIRKWAAKVAEKGLTIVPLAIYLGERGMFKVMLGLARGKTHGDKRQTMKEREHKREMDRAARRR